MVFYDLFLQNMQRRLKKLNQGDTRGKESMCELQNILNRKIVQLVIIVFMFVSLWQMWDGRVRKGKSKGQEEG